MTDEFDAELRALAIKTLKAAQDEQKEKEDQEAAFKQAMELLSKNTDYLKMREDVKIRKNESKIKIADLGIRGLGTAAELVLAYYVLPKGNHRFLLDFAERCFKFELADHGMPSMIPTKAVVKEAFRFTDLIKKIR